MNDNLLLMYLSELGQGRWPQFRQALDYLAEDEDDLYRTVKARQLSALGHMEFAFESDLAWSVCEPTIAWLSRVDQLQGVLCGYRSERLLSRVYACAERLDCEVTILPQEEGPDVVSVAAPSSNVGEQLAKCVGMQSQPDAVERLVEMLPRINAYLQLCPEQPAPRGYKIERYDTDVLRWFEVDADKEDGLYRYTHYRRDYRLRLNGSTWTTPPYVGMFALLASRDRPVLDYDPTEQLLKAPASTIFPPLFARTAVLCSGFLPRFENYQHVYSEVPPSVGYQLLRKLDQEREP